MSSVPPSVPGSSLRGAVDLSALVQRAARPAREAPSDGDGVGGAPAEESASPYVTVATDATFPRLIELSSTVPVLVEFIAAGLQPALTGVIDSYEGRLVLAVVDAQTNPQLAQAFQLSEVPAVAAVLGGRPISLFVGIPSEQETRAVIDELLKVAVQSGITGRVPAGEAHGDPEAGAAAEEPLPPLHQEAHDAISRGDYAAAVEAYRRAIRENPRDALAEAGLAQASLLQRLDGADAAAVRERAAADPRGVDAQLAVADLDVAGGHLRDAFDRLLELFPSLDAEGKAAVRARLLDYFEIAGPDDERVADARRRLANLLY